MPVPAEAPVPATDDGALEAALLDALGATDDAARAEAVFLLGAPRTGSTYLYQALIATLGLPYIANLTNERYPAHPLVGLCLQAGLAGREQPGYQSAYGKVPGLLAPSEGSGVMRHWFGGGHPSQVVSRGILPGRLSHLAATLNGVEALYGRPLLVKNAWNCFRVEALAQALPRAVFIWIRRDIVAAARSDLAARHAVHGDPQAWNSATPANVDALRALPPARQVVENQYEFTRALQTAFAALPPARRAELWYEDLVRAPAVALRDLTEHLPRLGTPMYPGDFGESAQRTPAPGVAADEARAIEACVAAEPARLGALRHAAAVPA